MAERLGGASPFISSFTPDTAKNQCGNNSLTHFPVALEPFALINYIKIVKNKEKFLKKSGKRDVSELTLQ